MVDIGSLPFSKARRAGNLLFVSGQLPIDAEGTVRRGDIREQTRLAIENLRNVLEGEGAKLTDVVKVTAWISDAALSPGYNEVYSEMFSKPYPARSTVVSGLLLPADIEIEAIAVVP